jgi:hypothetical protein
VERAQRPTAWTTYSKTFLDGEATKRSIVGDAASIFRHRLQTDAMRRIKALLKPLIEGPTRNCSSPG